MRRLKIRLLGRFEALVDERPVSAAAWPQCRAAELVKVLALAPGHRLPRDELLETLRPQLGADAAAANLHKAASYARRALGARDAVVVRGGMVDLAPDSVVTTDVERFERGDDAASAASCFPTIRMRAVRSRRGAARLRRRRLELLRRRAAWEGIVQEDAADEEAHTALARRQLERGDRVAAARQLRRLGDEFARLGVEPSAEARA